MTLKCCYYLVYFIHKLVFTVNFLIKYCQQDNIPHMHNKSKAQIRIIIQLVLK